MVKTIRQFRRLRQLDVARAAGIREDYLSKIETERVIPRPDTIRRLAEALNCSPEDLGFTQESDDANCATS
jgi:transcriptional regulator with XRE-family HTH domain